MSIKVEVINSNKIQIINKISISPLLIALSNNHQLNKKLTFLKTVKINNRNKSKLIRRNSLI